MSKPTVMVIGGAGYIGSHCARAFDLDGWSVVVFDNLSRGWRDFVRWGEFFEGDILSDSDLKVAFERHKPDLVVHLAALAYVGESVRSPESYYRTNTVGALNVLGAMRASAVSSLVFSSTCATYGATDVARITETHAQYPINPYGWSKFMVERMIESFSSAYDLRFVMLRYFNAAGADIAAQIGERHQPETHVIPLALQGLLGDGGRFVVNGLDYATRDGSCERDFIHVKDLADAHLLAAKYLGSNGISGAFNLGTGHGVTVLELIAAIERVTGRRLDWIEGPRRFGDPAILVADNTRAEKVLGFSPKFSEIDQIIEDAWHWHQLEVNVGKA